LGKLSKAIGYTVGGKALRHAKNMKLPSKKTFFIIAGVLSAIALLLLAGFIALVIFLIGLITPDAVNQTTRTVQEVSRGAVEATNPRQYIQSNGQIDVPAVEEQIRSLPPAQLSLWAGSFKSQINQLLEQGQIVQSQAEQLLKLLP